VLGRHSGISFAFCFSFFSRALVRAGEHRGVPRTLMVSSAKHAGLIQKPRVAQQRQLLFPFFLITMLDAEFRISPKEG
jgi:hypothetical protein